VQGKQEATLPDYHITANAIQVEMETINHQKSALARFPAPVFEVQTLLQI